MRSSLLRSRARPRARPLTRQDAGGDVPSKDAKAEAAKPDKDVVKASVEEDEQPVRRSISMRGKTLVLHGHPRAT